MAKKEYTAKSKYKNPDKYIERLKREIEWKDDLVQQANDEWIKAIKERDELRDNAYGEYWFEYSDPGAEKGVNLNGHSTIKMLNRIDIGDEVVMIAKVDSFTRARKGTNEANFMIKHVYVKPSRGA